MIRKRSDWRQLALVKQSLQAFRTETLFRNSVYLMLNTGAMGLFGFAFWLVVAHLYAPAQIGIAATLISSMNFIAYLSLLGVNSTFIRFLPKSKTRTEQIDTGLILVGLSAIVAGSIFVLGAPHFAPKLSLIHQSTLVELSFVVLCIGAAINLVTDSVFIAYRSAGYNLLVDGFVAGGLQLLLPLALIGLGAYGIFAAQGAAALAAAVVSLILLVRRFNYAPTYRISRTVLRNIKHYSAVSYSASMLTIIPTVILPIIVLNKLGAASAGYYYLASMMANVLFAIAYAIAQSLFAEGSYDESQLAPLIKRAIKFLSMTIVPASILLAALGPFVLSLLGKTYDSNASHVIMVLAASGPLVAACAVGGVVLSITKRLRALLVVNAAYTVTVCVTALLWTGRGLTWVGGAWLAGHAVEAALVFAILGFQHHQRLTHTARTPA